MVKVKKVFGELPENVAVLDEMVEFDAEGNGEASEAVAEILKEIPGYEVEEASEGKEPEGDSEYDEAAVAPEGDSEDETADVADLEAAVAPEASEAPKTATRPRRTAPQPK